MTVDSVIIIEGRRQNWFTIAGGTGLLKQDDFYGLNHINLAIGSFPAEQHYVELATGFSWAPVQETSQLSQSLDGSLFFTPNILDNPYGGLVNYFYNSLLTSLVGRIF